ARGARGSRRAWRDAGVARPPPGARLRASRLEARRPRRPHPGGEGYGVIATDLIVRAGTPAARRRLARLEARGVEGGARVGRQVQAIIRAGRRRRARARLAPARRLRGAGPAEAPRPGGRPRRRLPRPARRRPPRPGARRPSNPRLPPEAAGALLVIPRFQRGPARAADPAAVTRRPVRAGRPCRVSLDGADDGAPGTRRRRARNRCRVPGGAGRAPPPPPPRPPRPPPPSPPPPARRARPHGRPPW